jgi:hypothetical protein
MDQVGVISAYIGLIQLLWELARTAKLIYPAWEVLSLRRLRKNYSNLKQKFGTLQALVLIVIFPDAKQIVDRVEKHVLGAETDEAIILRKLTTDDCTMLAVAVCPVHLIEAEDVSKKFAGSYRGTNCYYSPVTSRS